MRYTHLFPAILLGSCFVQNAQACDTRRMSVILLSCFSPNKSSVPIYEDFRKYNPGSLRCTFLDLSNRACEDKQARDKLNIFKKRVNAQDKDGDTSLHIVYSEFVCEESLEYKSVEESDGWIKPLLDIGADPNIKNNDGSTPLHMAAIFHRPQTIKLLVERGADINAQCKYGRTALYQATSDDHSKSQYETAKSLLQLGADPNIKDYDPNTGGLTGCISPIHNAITKLGPLKIVELLVQYGANINAQNNKGATPIHCAIDRSRPDILEFLLSKGARVNVKDIWGNTPLHHAAIYDFVDLAFYAKSLINHGAYTDIKNNEGETPLDVAKRHVNSYGDDNKRDFIQYITNHPNPNPNSGNCIVQ